MIEQQTAEPVETSAFLEQQRAALGLAEAAFREQRTELGQMMSDLRELQVAIKKQQGADVDALAKENHELRHLLEQYEARLDEVTKNRPADRSKEVKDLKGENELLRKLLEDK